MIFQASRDAGIHICSEWRNGAISKMAGYLLTLYSLCLNI